MGSSGGELAKRGDGLRAAGDQRRCRARRTHAVGPGSLTPVVGAGDWRFYDGPFPPANWGALGQVRGRLAGADVRGNRGTFTGVRIRPFHALDAVRLLSGIRFGGEILAVVPRQPAIRLHRNIGGVQLELIEVVQRADA